MSFPFHEFDHFLHCPTQFGIDLGLILPVDTSKHQSRTGTDEAGVLIAPLDHLHVTRDFPF